MKDIMREEFLCVCVSLLYWARPSCSGKEGVKKQQCRSHTVHYNVLNSIIWSILNVCIIWSMTSSGFCYPSHGQSQFWYLYYLKAANLCGDAQSEWPVDPTSLEHASVGF